MPTLRVLGAHTELVGMTVKDLDEVLAVVHPERDHIQSYKDGRWDGYVRLYDRASNTFPAGLTSKVQEWLEKNGHDVHLEEAAMEELDLSRFSANFLPGITLWKHQCESILALLKNRRGIVKAPTGSGKTEIAAVVAQMFWEEFQWPTLIVVPKTGLCNQTAARLREYYGSAITVGEMGGDYKYTGAVTVATAAMLQQFEGHERTKTENKKKRKVWVPANEDVRRAVMEAKVLILDEVHHASAETWYEVAMKSKVHRRFGLSGSPLKDKELADCHMIGATGPIVHEVEATELIDIGVSAKPKICVVHSKNASGPDMPVTFEFYTVGGKQRKRTMSMPYKEAYVKALVECEEHNTAVVRATAWLVDHGKRTVVLCRHKAHWETLGYMLEQAGVPFSSVWGATDIPTRNQVKAALEDGTIRCVLASTIWDEGEDVPGIEAMVYAEGVEVNTNAIQRVGRGMRKKKTPGAANEVWIVDFIPTSHVRLLEHGLSRVKVWEAEGYEVYPLYEWPALDDTDYGDDLLPFLKWDELFAAL